MAAIESLRARARVRLEEATPAVWTDDEIDECLVATLEALSCAFPREIVATTAVDGGATTIPIPAGAIDVRRLTLADGSVVPKRGAPARSTHAEELAWEAFAGTIHLSRPLEAQTVTIWHTAPLTFDSLPLADEGLVVLGAVALALEFRAIQDAKRGSFGLALDDAVVARADAAFERAMRRRCRRARSTLVHAP